MKKLLPFALIFSFFAFVFNLCNSDRKEDSIKVDTFIAKVDSLVNTGNYSQAQLFADSAYALNTDYNNSRPEYLAINIKNLTSTSFQDSILISLSENEFSNLVSTRTLTRDYLQDDVLNARLGRILYNKRKERDYLTKLFKARGLGLTVKEYEKKLAKAKQKKSKRTYSKSYQSSTAYSSVSSKSYSTRTSGYTSVQCSGITKKGRQCLRMTTDPSGRCWQH